jgi:AraC-like DNA-binding protein
MRDGPPLPRTRPVRHHRAVARFTEHPAPAALAGAVASVWSHEPEPADADRPGRGVRVLPDGHTDVIVRLEVTPGGVRVEDAVLCGPTERFKLQPLPVATALVGVRFRLGAVAPVLGVSPAELAGGEPGLRSCGPRAAELFDAVRRASTVRECAEALGAGLANLAADRRADPSLQRGRWAAAALLGGGAGRLAGELGVSRRTLHRDVIAAAGLPPRTLSRVLRFRAAVDRLRTGGEPLAAAAAACGYADQAHLTREVRRFAGLPPAALLAAGRGGELQV